MTVSKQITRVAAGAALLGLAGCATGITVAPPPEGLDAKAPVAAPVEFALADASGPEMNPLGGEIPKAAPTDSVGEGGLSEARPDGG